MLELDLVVKFRELLIALAGAAFVALAATWVILQVRRRRIRLPFYVEAGGVSLSVGEERLLEAIARAPDRERDTTSLARALQADHMTVYFAALALKEKNLIVENRLPSGDVVYELSDSGNEAALARNYIKLV